jgi:hypothetical protein
MLLLLILLQELPTTEGHCLLQLFKIPLSTYEAEPQTEHRSSRGVFSSPIFLFLLALPCLSFAHALLAVACRSTILAPFSSPTLGFVRLWVSPILIGHLREIFCKGKDLWGFPRCMAMFSRVE